MATWTVTAEGKSQKVTADGYHIEQQTGDLIFYDGAGETARFRWYGSIVKDSDE